MTSLFSYECLEGMENLVLATGCASDDWRKAPRQKTYPLCICLIIRVHMT